MQKNSGGPELKTIALKIRAKRTEVAVQNLRYWAQFVNTNRSSHLNVVVKVTVCLVISLPLRLQADNKLEIRHMAEQTCESLININFESKIFSGITPSDDAWNAYLLKIYKELPACSPAVFANHNTNLGPSSYEILAKNIELFHRPAQRLIDLGSGSGHMLKYISPQIRKNDLVTAVDMSEDEIKIAAKDYGNNSQIKFVAARAQNLPFSDESIDLIGAHMSMMLMRPIEPVVDEIYRVLKKGGRLLAVTNSTEPASGTLGLFNATILDFIKSHYPQFKQLPNGDIRTRNLDGLKELFLPRFKSVEQFTPFYLNIEVTPDGAWAFCNTLVSVNIVPQDKRSELRSRILEIANAQRQMNGKVLLQMPLALWVVEK